VIRIMHTALLETIALGHTRVDRATVMQSVRTLQEQPDHTDDDAEGDLVIQTRIQLPGFEEISPPPPPARRRRTRPQGGA
jgi:hypothetical protein